MKEKKREIVIPILWNSWDELGITQIILYDAEFYENFGPFIKGESFSSVCIMYDKGLVEAYSEGGTEVVKSCKFKAIALND